MRRLRLALFAALLGPILPLPAQPAWHLRVVDSASGSPIRHAYLAFDRHWAASGDSAGRLDIDAVPATLREALVYCRPAHGAWQSLGAVQRVSLPTRPHDSTLVRLSGAACDSTQAPSRRVVLLGVGHSEYHGTWFRVCAASAGLLPNDLRAAAARARPYALVVAWMPFVRMPPGPRLPSDTSGGTRRYMRAEGTLEGPGHYGHRGLSLYRFEVETVHAIYPARPPTCP